MICDGSTCPKPYENTKIYDQNHYVTDDDEFIKILKHQKCKVIQLVRRQIYKFRDAQYQLPSMLDNLQRNFQMESQYISNNMNEDLNLKEDTSIRRHVTPHLLFHRNSESIRQAWHAVRNLKKIRQKICTIVLIAGLIVLIWLICSIYFRGYLCSNGKSCITSIRYSHAKHKLF